MAKDLAEAIVTGRRDSGARFPVEAELCWRYGASRTVLSDVMKTLRAKNLVSVRPCPGPRIRPETDWNLLDPQLLQWLLGRGVFDGLLIEFTEIRAAVEPGAAALAPSPERLDAAVLLG